MPRFAVMAKANRVRHESARSVNQLHVELFMQDAASADEAVGIGYRLIRKVYPADRGFTDHHAHAIPDTQVLKPESEWQVAE